MPPFWASTDFFGDFCFRFWPSFSRRNSSVRLQRPRFVTKTRTKERGNLKGKNAKRENEETSDAGPQYRCGRVGKGVQLPSTFNQIYKNISFFHFLTQSPRTNGPTYQQMDGQSLLHVSATKNLPCSQTVLQLGPGQRRWCNNLCQSLCPESS